MFEYEYLLELLTKRNLEIEQLRTYKVVVDYLKEQIMHSYMSIEDVGYVMSILNYAEDGECIRPMFYPEALVNKELRRVLEIL